MAGHERGRVRWALAMGLCGLLAGCGDDDGSPTGTSDAGSTPQSLCAKYGGAGAVDGVVRNQVLGAIAGDCRINAFFTTLPEGGLTHVADCLSTQVQELFGCAGVTYAGSQSTVGRPCRSMVDAHRGMGISTGDFDALIEDVVAGLTEAGVESADISAAAPALLGMKDDITETEAADPTREVCE